MGRLGGLIKPKGSTRSVSISLKGGHARQAIGPLSYVSLMVILSALILVVMHHLGIYELDSVFSRNQGCVQQTLVSQALTARYQSGNPHLEHGFGQNKSPEVGGEILSRICK